MIINYDYQIWLYIMIVNCQWIIIIINNAYHLKITIIINYDYDRPLKHRDLDYEGGDQNYDDDRRWSEAFPKHSDLNYDGGDHSEETKRIATKKSCDDIKGKKM